VWHADAERVTTLLEKMGFHGTLCFAHGVHVSQAVLDGNGCIIECVHDE